MTRPVDDGDAWSPRSHTRDEYCNRSPADGGLEDSGSSSGNPSSLASPIDPIGGAPLESLPLATAKREEVYRITLCGSTRFRAEYELWNRRLSMAGFLVYSVSCFGHSGDPLTKEEKARLDRVHLAKIDHSHAIVVINPGGYVGESTAREIAHAVAAGKPVYYLSHGRTVYQLRTGPDGAGSMRYRAFDHHAAVADTTERIDLARDDQNDGWRPIAEAPRDETRVALLTAGYRAFVGYFGVEVEGEDGAVWTWAAAEEDMHPPCWTDGLCWASNEDEEPSDPPTHWMPLPPPPATSELSGATAKPSEIGKRVMSPESVLPTLLVKP